jgi:hypothetical protein
MNKLIVVMMTHCESNNRKRQTPFPIGDAESNSWRNYTFFTSSIKLAAHCLSARKSHAGRSPRGRFSDIRHFQRGHIEAEEKAEEKAEEEREEKERLCHTTGEADAIAAALVVRI